MIQSLYIKNYVLIDELEMQFSRGFTTITGETGAGKSILMGALSLILGTRADTSVLKLKDAKCIVEGAFLPGKELRSLFEASELDYEELTTIRREIAPGGKSRAFINDTPVNYTSWRSWTILQAMPGSFTNISLLTKNFATHFWNWKA